MNIYPQDAQRPTTVVGMWRLWWGFVLGFWLVKREVMFRFRFRFRFRVVLGRMEIGSRDPDAMSNERLVRLRGGGR
jgi:hypothetical protein